MSGKKNSLLVIYYWTASAFNYKWLYPFEGANESPLTQHIPNGFVFPSVNLIAARPVRENEIKKSHQGRWQVVLWVGAISVALHKCKWLGGGGGGSRCPS